MSQSMPSGWKCFLKGERCIEVYNPWGRLKPVYSETVDPYINSKLKLTQIEMPLKIETVKEKGETKKCICMCICVYIFIPSIVKIVICLVSLTSLKSLG